MRNKYEETHKSDIICNYPNFLWWKAQSRNLKVVSSNLTPTTKIFIIKIN